jgi:hypothetical protein
MDGDVSSVPIQTEKYGMSVKNIGLIISVFLFMASGAAQAQTAGIVTLRANSTSATGSLVPVLTWSTNPAASSCRASGGWSGTHAASGTLTLPAITANTNYTLTCSWGTGSAVVSWVAPTANTNGTPLTNLAGFAVYYGTSSTSLTQSITVNNMAARSATISPLAPGTWYFKVRAINSSQVQSNDSNIASKAVVGATAASTVGITITPTAARLRTNATAVYDVVRSGSTYVLGRTVGTIAIGRQCLSSFRVGSNYYKVSRNDVTFSRTPRSNVVVARCASS